MDFALGHLTWRCLCLGAHAPRPRAQNPMANMDMAAFPGRTYRYLQVRRPSLQRGRTRLPWLSLELEVQPAARMLRRCCTAAAVLLVEEDGQHEPCKPAHRPGAAMQVPVLYPFGHGLSYASFAYSGLAATPAANGAAQSYSITVTVTNTGKHPSC